jgi:CDP-glucose 4,6-dehydratase
LRHMFNNFYQGKRVFLTGHTGFKGSWLAEWLLLLGAEVHGYALDPQEHERLFDQLNLSERLASDTRADLADKGALMKAIQQAQPDVVLHLAAQPLVQLSYDIPLETFATNVMGTANLLDAVRLAKLSCAVVCVTTDKCYENREWLHGYRESDPMGGHDPYSASKGAAELIISSYRNSFFSATGSQNDPAVHVASARAGNVIGGGDWAIDRIVPDCIRALREGGAIPVRNKIATRPWQHVLEPLSGYLWLGASLLQQDGKGHGRALESGFNFGPSLSSNRTVADLVQELLKHAKGDLAWQPVWDFEKTVEATASWYSSEASAADLQQVTAAQIRSYHSDAAEKDILWAQ